MNSIATRVVSSAVALSFALAPFAASAASASSSAQAGVFINASGIVRVIGADVTSVGGTVVNAVSHLGSVVINWVVNTSSTTKVKPSAAANASSTANISVGDKVSFVGSLSSSIDNTLTVAGTKIRDITKIPFRRLLTGTIASINNATGTFVLSHGKKQVSVDTNASTTVTLNGAVSSLASLIVGERARVFGTRAATSTIVASRVVVKTPASSTNSHDDGQNDSGTHSDNRGRSDIRLSLWSGLHLGK